MPPLLAGANMNASSLHVLRRQGAAKHKQQTMDFHDPTDAFGVDRSAALLLAAFGSARALWDIRNIQQHVPSVEVREVHL
jgi:hypothetical protein